MLHGGIQYFVETNSLSITQQSYTIDVLVAIYENKSKYNHVNTCMFEFRICRCVMADLIIYNSTILPWVWTFGASPWNIVNMLVQSLATISGYQYWKIKTNLAYI